MLKSKSRKRKSPKRVLAMVAILIGCGLRRAELLALTLESVQQ
jgi:integrase